MINGPANLLNNDQKNSSDWIILKIWALESFKSVDILLLKVFINFVFCLVVNNNSCGRSFLSSIVKFILRVVPVLLLAAALVFSLAYLSILHLLYCIQPFMCSYNTSVVLLENSSIVSFDCSRMQKTITLVFAAVDFILPVKIICWIALESASKAFCLQQLICIFFQNNQNPINNQSCNHHFILLIFS